MTYSRTPVTTPPSNDEVAYSPFTPDSLDNYASTMGHYEVFGPPVPALAFPTQVASARAPAYQPVYQAPTYTAPSQEYQTPPGYKLVPLSGDNGSSKGMTRGQKVLAALVVVGIVAAIVYLVRKYKSAAPEKEPLTPTQAVKKLPTSRLAQNLYQRLQRNGKGTKGVLTALDKLSQE